MSTAELLTASGLFDILDTAGITQLANSAETLRLEPGEPVFAEGDPADGVYFVSSGSVQVFSTKRDGSEVVLAKLESGTHFGEQALLPETDHRRGASVRSFQAAELVRVPTSAFNELLSLDSPLRSRVLSLGEAQLRENLQHQSTLFAGLGLDMEERSEWVREAEFNDGAIVIREGDPGDDMYLILEGTAGVFKNEGGHQRLLVQLRAGQCFGELALLEKQPRSATVVAQGTLKTLRIDGDHFLRMYEGSPDLQSYMGTLRKVYQSSGRGFTTQHAGRFMGRECITTIYHLEAGERAVASRVVADEIFNLRLVGEAAVDRTVLYFDEENFTERELSVAADGRLLGILVYGLWEELGEAHALLLEGACLADWQLSVFERLGVLHLEAPTSLDQDHETVCACIGINRGALRTEITSGAATAADLVERTGAGSVCGSCMPRLHEMVGHEDWMPVEVVSVEDQCDDVRAFRMRPFEGAPGSSQPGQHVVVQARVDGDWIERSYTLTSTEADDAYEITVKKEHLGAFSTWLFEQRTDRDLVRVSSPQGHYFLDTSETESAICVVGGIGMTPALAMARQIDRAGLGLRLHIEYCASSAESVAYEAELRALAAERPNITFELRITSESGRLPAERLATLNNELSGANWFLCGPDAFQRAVQDALIELEVPAERVAIETFEPAGGPAAGDSGQCPIDHRDIAAVAHEKTYEDYEVQPIAANADSTVAEDARAFLYQFYFEKGVPEAFASRWSEVEQEILLTGTWHQTFDELSFGAKLAWRNSTRCVGRLFWSGLQIRDFRHLTDEAEMFEAMVDHIRLATNGGNLRALMTVFAPAAPGQPGMRLWNGQLLRYAGYRQEDGSILGDPANVELTDEILELGWQPKAQTAFDILPLVIQKPGAAPRMFEIPPDVILEVPIEHPEYGWFGGFGLKWYALPAVSEMLFDIGGVQYTMAPFNGWYMGTEIGARNFTDRDRYDLLLEVAQKMGLDTRRNRDLWRDRAAIEINRAVLHSFEQRGVKMMDHHAASDDFMSFVKQESDEGRPVFATWPWVVPPVSGSITEVFHVEWQEHILKPNYFYQTSGWKAQARPS